MQNYSGPENEEVKRDILIMIVFVLFSLLLTLGFMLFTAVISSYLFFGRVTGIFLIGALVHVVFMLGGFIGAHNYHGKVMFPFYLLSTLMMALMVYGFLASLIVSIPLGGALIIYGASIPKWLSMVLEVIFLLLIISPILYGSVEARHLRIRRPEVRIEGIEKDARIALITDVHLGLIVGRRRMKRILSILEEERPDIIVVGGDLYDTNPSFITHLKPYLKKMASIAPTYAVTGNHELFNGLNDCVRDMEESGMTVLRERWVRDPSTGLVFVGIDDTRGAPGRTEEISSLEEVFEGIDRRWPVVFISHEPADFRKAVSLGTDLMLSGHTHAGQIWPFSFFTKRFYRDGHRGLNRWKDSYLYVSAGAGTWGPPIRVFAPPEVAIIRVY